MGTTTTPAILHCHACHEPFITVGLWKTVWWAIDAALENWANELQKIRKISESVVEWSLTIGAESKSSKIQEEIVLGLWK